MRKDQIINGVTYDHFTETLIQCPTTFSGVLTVPERVKTIRSRAFLDCTGLQEIRLPKGLLLIEKDAFRGCTGLQKVVLPDSLMRLEVHAFSGCTSLEEVWLPKSMNRLAGYPVEVFHNCPALQRIHIPAGGDYVSRDGVVYTADGKTLQFVPRGLSGTFIVPEEVTGIYSDAFAYCHRLTKVRLGERVELMGTRAFYLCTALEEVELSPVLELVDTSAFAGCAALKAVSLPPSVKQIGFWSFHDNTVVDCTPEQFNKLPMGTRLTTIRRDLRDLEKLTKEAKQLLLRRVKRLRADLLEKMIQVDDAAALAAFYSLPRRVSADELAGAIEDASRQERYQALAALMEVRNRLFPPEELFRLEMEQMEKALGLQEKTVADWRKEYRFYIRNGEVTITLYRGGESVVEVPEWIGKNRVTTISGFAFSFQDQLEEVILPDSVTKIEELSFKGSRNLRNVIIPPGVSHFPTMLFRFCDSMDGFQIDPRNPYLTSIDGIVYSKDGKHLIRCPENRKGTVTIPEGVQSLEHHGFCNCSGVEKLFLPSSLEEIKPQAFDCGIYLREIHFTADVRRIDPDAFEGLYGVVIHGPAGSNIQRAAAERRIPFCTV